jgi:transposase-like protein
MKREENRARWQRLVEHYEASGLTQVAFAKQRGLNAKTLQRWRKRLRSEGALPAVIEVVVEDVPAPPPARNLELLVGRDLSLCFAPGTSPGYVADIVVALKARRAC